MPEDTFIPLTHQIKDIMDKAKLQQVDRKANTYAEEMVDWLKDNNIKNIENHGDVIHPHHGTTKKDVSRKKHCLLEPTMD